MEALDLLATIATQSFVKIEVDGDQSHDEDTKDREELSHSPGSSPSKGKRKRKPSERAVSAVDSALFIKKEEDENESMDKSYIAEEHETPSPKAKRFRRKPNKANTHKKFINLSTEDDDGSDTYEEPSSSASASASPALVSRDKKQAAGSSNCEWCGKPNPQCNLTHTV